MKMNTRVTVGTTHETGRLPLSFLASRGARALPAVNLTKKGEDCSQSTVALISFKSEDVRSVSSIRK